MNIKSPPQARSANVDRQRRKVVKLMIAGGASTVASPWVFRSARAAGRTVKIGMVSPPTGPIAAFGEADQFVLAGVRKALANGITIAGETHPVEIIYKDSQSNPNRASEVAAQLINNDTVDIMIASSTSDTCQSGLRPMRAQRRALHHLRRSVAGLVLPAQGRPEEGLRVDLPLLLGLRHGRRTCSPTCGCRCRPTRTSAPCSPTIRTASPPTTTQHGLPATFRTKGFNVLESRPLSAAVGRLHGADRRAEERQLRDRLRHLQPAAVRDLLDAVRAAGLPAEDRDAAQGAAVPHRRRGARRPRRRHVDRGVVVAAPSVQVGPHRRDRAAVLRRLHGGDRQAVDPADRLQARQSRGRDRRAQARQEARRRLRSATPSRTTNYQSLVGPITWKGGPTNPVPNVCTTPLVGGQWKKGKKFKYDLHIVYNKTAPNIPLDSAFEAIKYS